MRNRILVVGCGSIGERHIRLLQEIDGVELAAVDPLDEKREEVRQRFGVRGVYAALDKVPSGLSTASSFAPAEVPRAAGAPGA
jgi:predicted dehydrogenase